MSNTPITDHDKELEEILLEYGGACAGKGSSYNNDFDRAKQRIKFFIRQEGSEALEAGKAIVEKRVAQTRVRYERRGMAFVHASVTELSEDAKMLKKLDDIVQDRLAALKDERSKL